MPLPAASLDEAIALTNQRTSTQFGVPGRLFFYISEFSKLDPAVGWPGNFNPKNEKERTVRNWIVESLVVQSKTPSATDGDVQQVQNVVNVVCRVMYATQAALLGGRISAAQEASVLTAWNNSFGLVP